MNEWVSDDNRTRILLGDCLDRLRGLPSGSVHCCVTSPPYWGLRDYGVSGQLGLEQTPEEYTRRMAEVFAEVRRVLRDDGTLWLNLGDSYGAAGGNTHGGPSSGLMRGDGRPEQSRQSSVIAAALQMAPQFPSVNVQTGLKPKNLIGIPWRVAFALQADGWYLRQDIIWHKSNPMPESVRDRCTKAHEYVFLLAKSQRYYYDAEAVSEPSTDTESLNGRRPRKTRKDHKAVFSPRGMEFTSERSGFLKGKLNDAGRTYPTRNRRSVWTITPKPYSGAHFATMPPELARLCILAGCPVGGTVLDPFAGSGTTLQVARWLDRVGLGIELNPTYLDLARERVMTPEGKRIKRARQEAGLPFPEGATHGE